MYFFTVYPVLLLIITERTLGNVNRGLVKTDKAKVIQSDVTTAKLAADNKTIAGQQNITTGNKTVDPGNKTPANQQNVTTGNKTVDPGNKTLANQENVTTGNKIVEPGNKTVVPNPTGLKELHEIIGKENVAQIKRDFHVAEKTGWTLSDDKESPKAKNDTEVSEDDGGKTIKLSDDFKMSVLSESINNNGRREVKQEKTEQHQLVINANLDQYTIISPKPNVDKVEEIRQDDKYTGESPINDINIGDIKNQTDTKRSGNIRSGNQSDTVLNFIVREFNFTCTEGKYYKRGDCNLCYCTKGSQWKPCTRVKCAKHHVDFSANNLASDKNNQDILKLRQEATGCVPGQKIKVHSNVSDECICICTLPSIMDCPLCARHIDIDEDLSGSSSSDEE